MDDDLFARLRRLGVVRGTRNLRPTTMSDQTSIATPSTGAAPTPLELLLPGGRVTQTDDGACFVVDRVYPISHHHGHDALADLLQFQPVAGARYGLGGRLDGLDFHDFIFLDTETTGLGGAGALAFMVGVGFFESWPDLTDDHRDAAFVVRQFFLRDPGDERAMLRQLDELLATRSGLVTFNGRSFDVPLLDNRYLLNRLHGRLPELPHIDLLPPARRLWRARLGSCALGALEQNLLNLRRTHEDVPGWQIPTLYYDYLRTGDARELTRVFYHNEMDMLSMVTLASRIFKHITAESTAHDHDLLSLARWQADVGMMDEAERTLRRALDGDLDLPAYHQALQRLAAIYKQTGRRSDAVVLWSQLAVTSTHAVIAHIELAKHYEWHEADASTALVWTQRALDLVARCGMSPGAVSTREELLHRRRRLEVKLS